MGYERHDQCSCSIGLAALLTSGCVQVAVSKTNDLMRPRAISIVLNGWLRDRRQRPVSEAIVHHSLRRLKSTAINGGMRLI